MPCLILILCCQICPASFCGLHKKMTADIGRHLLAQQCQCLLVHTVFCTPAYQRRKIVFGGSQQTFKFCAEAVIQQVEEQAGQIFALFGRCLQCLRDLAQVSFSACTRHSARSSENWLIRASKVCRAGSLSPSLHR